MQTSYSINMNPAIAGTLYDLSPHTVDSYVSQIDNVGLGFGVIAGTDPQSQVTVAAATFSSGFKGIVLNQAKEQSATGAVVYNTKDTVPVLRKGRAWVPVTGAVTAESPAFLTFSGADTGKWAAAAGTGPVAVAVANAKFITSTTGAGLAVVELS
jgi:hypothetical protein